MACLQCGRREELKVEASVPSYDDAVAVLRQALLGVRARLREQEDLKAQERQLVAALKTLGAEPRRGGGRRVIAEPVSNGSRP